MGGYILMPKAAALFIGAFLMIDGMTDGFADFIAACLIVFGIVALSERIDPAALSRGKGEGE